MTKCGLALTSPSTTVTQHQKISSSNSRENFLGNSVVDWQTSLRLPHSLTPKSQQRYSLAAQTKSNLKRTFPKNHMNWLTHKEHFILKYDKGSVWSQGNYVGVKKKPIFILSYKKTTFSSLLIGNWMKQEANSLSAQTSPGGS